MARKAKDSSAYAAAGVNIDEMDRSLAAIKRMVQSTSRRKQSSFGAFGGMFPSPGSDHVLVSSTDSVGTKLKMAVLAGRHDTVGQDIVNHCVNDVLVQGAEPLFFLDYLGVDRLKANMFREIVSGICKACRQNDCELLGGETAELPGLYPKGEYDLVGTVVGAVKTSDIVTGEAITPGDVVIGLPSTGLHTNGYSLARKIVLERAKLKPHALFPGTRRTVASVLLAVHRSYLKPVQALKAARIPIHGMAHITGGGFLDNIPRVLPPHCRAVIHEGTWRVQPVFEYLESRGRVSRDEMYRVFNMGIGYVIIVPSASAERTLRVLRAAKAGPKAIGYIERGSRGVRIAKEQSSLRSR
ncbi:MAG: phosphoribosylformylglycinamidine cyclo-ligase [Verrucomicrobia bacterium]|nr:phosphoribosylformylglycinamidine cyclo-ligase [Verrucomicrobiota bacterium]MDA1088408.1 phosphoribosylformylglycinamidine cyclo-ligase [Verrucomicrobiota bacterium]